MSKNTTQRRGLALGAIVGLVASLFAGAAPATATPATNGFYFAPTLGTSFNTLVDEDFSLNVVRNPSVVASGDMGIMKYQITTNRTWNSTFSMEVWAGIDQAIEPASTSDAAKLAEYANQNIYYNGSNVNNGSAGSTISGTVDNAPATLPYVIEPASTSGTLANQLSMVFHGGLTSASPTLTVTVTAFLDVDGDNEFDSTTEISATQTVTFLTYASVTRAITVPAVTQGDTSVRPSATVSGLNLEQLGGTWAMQLRQWGPTPSGEVALALDGYDSLNGTSFTFSAPVALAKTFAITAATGSFSVSASLVYLKASADVASSSDKAITWLNVGTTTAVTPGVTAAPEMYVVPGVNARGVSAFPSNAFEVRPNNTYTVVLSASSVASASATTALVTFSNPALSAVRNYSVNGGAAVTTLTASALTLTFDKATGLASFTVSLNNFAPGDVLTLSAKVTGFDAEEIAIKPVDLTWSLDRDAAIVATAPATAVAVGVTVEDQFGVKSAMTNQRIKFSWATGYGGTATTSYVAVVGGVAQASMTPSRTPVTGSATITAELENQTPSTGLWSDDASAAVTFTVTVTDAANGFRVGLAKSYSASISYGADFSWSAVIDAARVVITGSPVVVSGTGLIFKDSAGKTASDTITLAGNADAKAEFYVTARLAGTYTVTLTAGTATTTSQIVVMPARSDDGASVIWDTTTIEAGKTRIVVGTLVDANGNPVNTTGAGTTAGDSGTASMLVTFQGTAGIPVGAMPTETDADGKFQVSVLTSANDRGTFTLTATYYPQGAATAVADVVTSVNSITVGAATSTPASDQKLTVGSFKGFVAIYALNYTGQKLSAKVAGKWLTVNELSRFQRVVRNTGAGYTIKVDLYIDGAFVRSETVVTK